MSEKAFDFAFRFTLVLIPALLAPFASAEIVINEFTGNNTWGAVDDDGDHEDWLELYNTGDVPVDLEGYGLTDDPEDPFQWVFPSRALDPGEHLLVWTSGKDRSPAPGERQNGVFREYFRGVAGSNAYQLIEHISFPDSPQSRTLITDFFEAPRDFDDQYGQRMHGFITPPQTGEYTFWIAGDDASRLYLNPGTDTEVDYDDPIAYIPEGGWSGWREWDEFPDLQESDPIFLEAGEHYYISAIMNEGIGGDHLSVRWELPDGTMEEPIPASRLSTGERHLHANFSIDEDGEALQLTAPGGAVVDAADPISLPRDVSYGRSSDGGGEWVYFDEPTPGSSNNDATGYAGVLDPPTFSHTSGFYPDAFSLTLEPADPDAAVYYSVDSSVPDPGHVGGDPEGTSRETLPYDGAVTVSMREGEPLDENWQIEGDELVQTSMDTGVLLRFGDTEWQDYEYTLQARKSGGNEGFLILFRVNGSDYYQLNLGGWGNDIHAIQKVQGGGGGVYRNLEVPGSIETDVWYDVRIRVQGDHIRCWLDGDLIFDFTDDSSPYMSGQVGVGTWATRARYRNIEVTSLDGETTLFSGLPEIPMETFNTTVVRARSFREGYLPSEVATQTYFVDPEAAERFDMPMVSVATEQPNLFGDYGLYVAGKSQEDGGEPNFMMRGIAWERPAHVTFFEPDGEVGFAQDSGIRIHGGWTRNFDQKSLRLYARGSLYGETHFAHRVFPEQPFPEYKRLLLRNSGNDNPNTMFRDGMMQRLVEHLRLDTQAFRPAAVYLNGQYWGMHNLRERYDKHYLAHTYGVDPDNVDILEFLPSEPHGVKEGDDDHYNATLDYIETHGLSDADDYEHIKTRIDVENFRDYNVAQIFFNNSDWPGNNNDFWRFRAGEYDPRAPYGHDGRWRWMLFDTDFGFGLNQGVSFNLLDAVTQTDNTDWWNQPPSTFLLRELLKNDSFRDDFIVRFADLLNTAFLPERVIDVIDEMQALVEPEMDHHIERWGQPGNWSGQVNVMRNFAEDRPAHMRSHLRSKFGLSESDLTVDVSDPAAGYVRVNTVDIDEPTPGVGSQPYPWTGVYFEDVPMEVRAVARPGYRFSHWEEMEGSPEGESRTVSLSLDGDRTLTAVFEEHEPPLLLHYWHFNGLTAGTVSEVAADQSATGGAAVTYPGSGEGYLDDTDGSERNVRLGEEAGRGLRVRNPSDSRSLQFTLPTTGYEEVRFSYAVRRTPNGARGHAVEYSTEEARTDWRALDHDAVNIREDYQVLSFDFSGIPEVNDNPHFAVRILFTGADTTGTSGNNRFDNVTLDAVPLAGTQSPPSLDEPLPRQELTENGGATVDLDSYFSSESAEPLTYSVANDSPWVVLASLSGSELTLDPQYRGGATITVEADDGVNEPVAAEFYLLVYPEAHDLAGGDFTFDAWNSGTPENTFPEHMLFLQSDLTDPGLADPLEYAYFIPEDDYDPEDSVGFPYNNANRTRLNGLGDDGISFINTGRDRDLGGALVAIDTVGQDEVYVSWIGGTVTPDSRVYRLRLQYRTSADAAFADLTDGEGAPVEYVRNADAGHTEQLGPVALPADALGEPEVQLLWRYYYTGVRLNETSGARDELRLDNVRVTTQPGDSGNGEITYADWRDSAFPDPGDRDDPEVSGPEADPRGDGTANLVRYAFGIGLSENPNGKLPWLETDETGRLWLVFPYPENRADIDYLVGASADLATWETIFDTRTDPAEPGEDGNLHIDTGANAAEGPPDEFFRVRILLDEN